MTIIAICHWFHDIKIDFINTVQNDFVETLPEPLGWLGVKGTPCVAVTVRDPVSPDGFHYSTRKI